uniref:Pentatricopeptide repeat-containing protein At5g66520-like n=1 Tax=Tanacetum cinerariifolium TaxID=118510 RepID=A0A699HE65_TANCI|nr:pentatricopeptide repeat-containing protein At5g66520-like [Tanacetum cinerariifolium]
MRRESITIDSYTILYTLKTVTHFYNAPLLRHLHAHIVKLGFTSNVYVMSSLLHGYTNVCFKDACNMFDEMSERSAVAWNTMITGFSRLGNVDKARCLFHEMPVRSVASWAAMISGYVSNGCWNNGIEVFREMVRDEKVKPDEFTLCAVLGGCGRMDMIGLVLGKSVHGFIVRNEWGVNVELGTALVDMYAKCGFLKVATLVFNRMRETNVVSWTALICGAAQNGYVNEARTLFERMQKMGVRPNEFTFTGILSACVQAGLVEEGRRYFQMIGEYDLKPNVHHYCCIVDLFGKAGELEDAYAVIMTMKPTANMNVWGSFLNSCKVQNNFKMAERVIYKVLEMLRPEYDGGVYTLISDLFVMGEKWDDAERMRRLIVSQNVRKARGVSFMSSRSNLRT